MHITIFSGTRFKISLITKLLVSEYLFKLIYSIFSQDENIPDISATELISKLDKFNSDIPKHSENIKPIVNTLEVSKLEISNEVRE